MISAHDLPTADVLLVVPPMAHITWPSLGVHQLAACAREAGFEVAILYANAVLAARLGPLAYANLANAPGDWLMGERLFARAAHGLPALGSDAADFLAEVAEHNSSTRRAAQQYLDHLSDVSGQPYAASDTAYPHEALLDIERTCHDTIAQIAQAIAERGYRIVGCSSTFDQTNASAALLRQIKQARPQTVTLLGGSNCEQPMASSLAGVVPWADHLFAGESERTFVEFLAGRSGGRILEGVPCTDLDALPTPDFRTYFDQMARWLPELGEAPLWLSYETSRGCWWGQKSHCTFCGLNGLGMGFREKSPERVLQDLDAMMAYAPTRHVCMTDNIMPFHYHTTLIPQMAQRVPDLHIFYEQKANLTLDQVQGLWNAGNRTIQPGIEALDTPLLQLMRKGVKARQNVNLLRYARGVGLAVKWNLLWGFPGDDEAMYERTLALVRQIHHLCPPNALTHLAIDRFSPYFDQADHYGLTEVTPLASYRGAFPAGADHAGIAYHFRATYRSGSDESQALMAELNREIWRWREAWSDVPGKRPALQVTEVSPGVYTLIDTRGLGGPQIRHLTAAQAVAVLVGGPIDKVPLARWAIDHGYAVALDGWCCALAVAHYGLMARLEAHQPEVPRAMEQLQVTPG